MVVFRDRSCLQHMRQIEHYNNGMILGYNSGMSHDEFGGLSTELLDALLDGFDFTNDAEFNPALETTY